MAPAFVLGTGIVDEATASRRGVVLFAVKRIALGFVTLTRRSLFVFGNLVWVGCRLLRAVIDRFGGCGTLGGVGRLSSFEGLAFVGSRGVIRHGYACILWS